MWPWILKIGAVAASAVGIGGSAVVATYEYTKSDDYTSCVKALIAQGIDPTVAATNCQASTPKTTTWMDEVKTPLIIFGAIYLFGPILLKSFQGRMSNALIGAGKKIQISEE